MYLRELVASISDSASYLGPACPEPHQTGEQWDGVVSGNGGQVIGFVAFNNLNLGVPVFAWGQIILW